MISALGVCPELVVAVLRDIAHPGQRLVAALFDNLEVAHLNAAHREVRNFELDLNDRVFGAKLDSPTNLDGRFSFHFVGFDRGQTERGAHQKLLSARKTLHLPGDDRLFGQPLAIARRCAEFGRIGVARHRNQNLHIVRRRASLELGARLHHDLHPRVGVLLNVALHPNQRFDLRLNKITEY